MSVEDKELDEMFHGEDKPLHPDTVHINLGSNNSITVGQSQKRKTPTAKEEKPAQKTSNEPINAHYEPVPYAPTQMDKLKACGKDALLYGALSLMFFYFQQTGQMLPSAAMPCICVCCIMLGLGVGKNAR